MTLMLKLNETNPIHPGKPWYNDDCINVTCISKPKGAEVRFNYKYSISDNLDNFRVIRAKARGLQTHFILLFAVFYASLQN